MTKLHGRVGKIEASIAGTEIGGVFLGTSSDKGKALSLVSNALARLTEELWRKGQLSAEKQRQYLALHCEMESLAGPGVRVIPPLGVRVNGDRVERVAVDETPLVEAAMKLGWNRRTKA